MDNGFIFDDHRVIITLLKLNVPQVKDGSKDCVDVLDILKWIKQLSLEDSISTKNISPQSKEEKSER